MGGKGDGGQKEDLEKLKAELEELEYKISNPRDFLDECSTAAQIKEYKKECKQEIEQKEQEIEQKNKKYIIRLV